MSYKIEILILSIVIVSLYLMLHKSIDRQGKVSGQKYEWKPCSPVYDVDAEELCFYTIDRVVMSEQSFLTTKDDDVACYKTHQDVFAYSCNNEVAFYEKPETACVYHSHSVCKLISYISSIFHLLVSMLFVRLMKDPILYTTHISSTLMSKKLSKKQCEKCKTNYLILHPECRSEHRSSPNHLVFYGVVFFSLFISVANCSPVVDYEDTLYKNLEKYTEIRVADEENNVQVFKLEGSQVSVRVVHSLVELVVEQSHEVMKIKSELVPESDYFCVDQIERCTQKFGNHTGFFYKKKNSYTFHCPFTSSVVCGYCHVRFEKESDIFRVVDEIPLITLEVSILGETSTIKIPSFNKPTITRDLIIEPVVYNKRFTGKKVAIQDGLMRIGNICEKSGDGCYGDVKKINNKVEVVYNPIVVEDEKVAIGVVMSQCIEKNSVDITTLDIVDQNTITLKNRTIHVMDYEFGYFRLDLKENVKKSIIECRSLKRISEVHIEGCYDCQPGVLIVVSTLGENCGLVECDVSGTVMTHKVNINNKAEFRLHSMTKSIIVTCNGYRVSATLSENKDYGRYISHQEHHIIKDAGNFSFPNIVDSIVGPVTSTLRLIITLIVAVITSFILFEVVNCMRILRRIRRRPYKKILDY
nr:putative glycoprotein precursor [Perilla mosaic virus]